MVNSFAKFLLFSFLHKDMFDWIVIQEGMENVKLFFSREVTSYTSWRIWDEPEQEDLYSLDGRLF